MVDEHVFFMCELGISQFTVFLHRENVRNFLTHIVSTLMTKVLKIDNLNLTYLADACDNIFSEVGEDGSR